MAENLGAYNDEAPAATTAASIDPVEVREALKAVVDPRSGSTSSTSA